MKNILDTQFVKIVEQGVELKVYIAMSDGGYVEHNPFKNDLQGLTNALQLATECCAGRYYPKRVLGGLPGHVGAEPSFLPNARTELKAIPKKD